MKIMYNFENSLDYNIVQQLGKKKNIYGLIGLWTHENLVTCKNIKFVLIFFFCTVLLAPFWGSVCKIRKLLIKLKNNIVILKLFTVEIISETSHKYSHCCDVKYFRFSDYSRKNTYIEKYEIWKINEGIYRNYSRYQWG